MRGTKRIFHSRGGGGFAYLFDDNNRDIFFPVISVNAFATAPAAEDPPVEDPWNSLPVEDPSRVAAEPMLQDAKSMQELRSMCQEESLLAANDGEFGKASLSPAPAESKAKAARGMDELRSTSRDRLIE